MTQSQRNLGTILENKLFQTGLKFEKLLKKFVFLLKIFNRIHFHKKLFTFKTSRIATEVSKNPIFKSFASIQFYRFQRNIIHTLSRPQNHSCVKCGV